MADAIPLNGIILWTGGACPTGYTRFSALDARYLVSNTTYNAAAGGAASHSHANLASHTHSASLTTSTDNPLTSSGTDGTPHGQSSSHNHSISGTSTGGTVSIPSQTVDPSYATVILCQRTT